MGAENSTAHNCGDPGSGGRGRAARRLARAQHQVIAARQLLALGFTEKAIRHRVASGRLWPLARGVYAVGPPRETDEQRWMAAVLMCGIGAALSHRSAAALWGIGAELPGRTDLSVRRRCGVRRAGRKSQEHGRGARGGGGGGGGGGVEEKTPPPPPPPPPGKHRRTARHPA